MTVSSSLNPDHASASNPSDAAKPQTEGVKGSAYFLEHLEEVEHKTTYAIIVNNEAGVLHRVVGLFAARGYNIESLTVAETDHTNHMSRITIVTRGTDQALAHIKAQLEKMVCTREVIEVSKTDDHLERELALLKVVGTGGERMEALRLSDIFRARVIDTTHESFVFEISGSSAKIDKFETLMRPLGLVETARTGVLSFSRGTKHGLDRGSLDRR